MGNLTVLQSILGHTCIIFQIMHVYMGLALKQPSDPPVDNFGPHLASFACSHFSLLRKRQWTSNVVLDLRDEI